MRTYYFGCINGPGHFLWDVEGHKTIPDRQGNITFRLRGGTHPIPIRTTPFKLPWSSIDGKLTPRDDKAQGAALIHYKDGWTALALHDYSVDTRPGSNSVFFFDEVILPLHSIQEATKAFPGVMKRIQAAGIIRVLGS